MIAVQADWSGGIDALVEEANRWLVRLLPVDRAARPKDEVNPRLVRHYTTQGLLPAPRREGRDARYDRHHLVALLALRRLMADGLGGKALTSAVVGQSELTLERLALEGALEQERTPEPDENEALRYLQRLSIQRNMPEQESLVAAPVLQGLVSIPTFPKRIRQMTRVLVRPGLDLHLESEFRWPQTEAQWTTLLQAIEALLREARPAPDRRPPDH